MANIQEFINSISFDSERFLPVKNFEGRFWISNHGRLISFNHKYKIIKGYIDSTGYVSMTLRMKPLKYKIRLHALVGSHFCKMIVTDKYMAWNHKDGNKLNNHFSNLEYITAKENCEHARNTGLVDVKGENHGMSKLKNEQVESIFSLRNRGLSHTAISKMFNLSRRQTSDIINGKAWVHITSRLP